MNPEKPFSESSFFKAFVWFSLAMALWISFNLEALLF
jgi:hypothetical protein